MSSRGRLVVSSSGRLRLYERLGRAYELAHDTGRAREAYEGLLEEAREAGDPEAEWTALIRLSTLSTDMAFEAGRDEELLKGVRARARPEQGLADRTTLSLNSALRRADEALSIARRLDRPDLVARSALVIGSLSLWASRWTEVGAPIGEARRLYAEAGDRPMQVECLGGASFAEVMLGRPQEGVRLGREAMRLGRELGSEVNLAANTQPTATALVETGAYEEALAVVREGLALARSLGNAGILFTNLWALEEVSRALLDRGAAREACRELREVAAHGEYRTLVSAKLCAASALSGDWEEANEHALRALGGRDFLWLPPTDLHLHHDVEALLRGGEEALARREVRRLGDRVAGNARFRVALLRSSAVLARWDGETELAVRLLREAEALAEGMGLPGELWQIRAALGGLHGERGESVEADGAFAGAARVVGALADKIGDERLKEGFLLAPPVVRVLERGVRFGEEQEPWDSCS